ncbi:MAG: NADH-quinone oxidoreductase subunit NuoN [Gammaproteobacteria bacterium]|nr:NADH-quinone oxidoreductase subunit NuoN [Gammaproteobacteria bacterium]MDH5513872.1 NADH-quinone oxidoreductase subunit NuoN [Gammaproteobacteria bacterium]
MIITLTEYLLLSPEIFILTMACLILVVEAFVGDRYRQASYVLAQLTLLVAAFISGSLIDNEALVMLGGMYVHDPMAALLKTSVFLVTIGAFAYARSYMTAQGGLRGEYYVLGLFAVLGMQVMISSHSLLTVYLGLELLSLSLYAMVAFDRDSPTASEAAMKYFVLGALASGMLLYGMSMLYGATGSLDIATIADVISAQGERSLVLVFGLCFIVVGLAFKFGAVPFHMWVPDVYHGAPTAVTLFIGSAPKIAAFAMAMRLLAESMGGLLVDWQGMLMILAVLSLAIGNVVAIAQTNMKRMLAYSTISHVGFLMLGILSGTDSGYSASMFYAITYALMAIGGFGVIILLSRSGEEADQLDDFRGLNDRSPWFALMMLILMFSMAGVPPTVGFYAKLAVLKAVIDVDMVWLALVAVFFSIIGAFYYIRIIKLMYFDEPVTDAPLKINTDLQIAVSTNSLLVLGLGLFPGALLALCNGVLA